MKSTLDMSRMNCPSGEIWVQTYSWNTGALNRSMSPRTPRTITPEPIRSEENFALAQRVGTVSTAARTTFGV